MGGTCLDYGGMITLGERKIAVTHGHLEREIHRLEGLGPAYFLSGHTHWLSRISVEDRSDGSIPGALHLRESPGPRPCWISNRTDCSK